MCVLVEDFFFWGGGGGGGGADAFVKFTNTLLSELTPNLLDCRVYMC